MRDLHLHPALELLHEKLGRSCFVESGGLCNRTASVCPEGP